MKNKVISLNGDKFVFVCRSKSVSGGFRHLCTLLKMILKLPPSRFGIITGHGRLIPSKP